MTLLDLASDQDVFTDAFNHLAAELEWLDLMLTRAVLDLRCAVPAAAPDPAVHVSDGEVDRLLARPPDGPGVDTRALDERIAALRARIDARVALAHASQVDLPLPALADRLGLSAFERHALLLCLAPELDRKYDRLYAYLQDDITRQRPSVDLVIGVLVAGEPERWRALRRFSAHAPLRRSGLLEVVTDPYSPSGSTALARMLRVAPRFAAHLLGDDQLDDTLAGVARRIEAPPSPATAGSDGEQARGLTALVDRHLADPPTALIVHLHGSDGTAPAEMARAVATRHGRRAVELDLAAVPGSAADLRDALHAALREGWLLGSPTVLMAAGRLFTGDEPGSTLDDALRRHPGVVLAASEQPLPAARRPRSVPVHEVELPPPDLRARRTAWTAILTGAPALAHELAGRFRLTPGQIRAVAADVARVTQTALPTRDDWYSACRRASGQGLATVAEKLTPIHGWDDLVLDEHSRGTLLALRDQVVHRERVLDDWGLGTRIAGSRGLSALFAGPPGTGKTMAAAVVAADLGLDLYRVDLSRVVSKYIGETEKNLSRIFAEAHEANAVLLFDEADALFGKRTDVSDAHDRYANIEVSYLLQRMEHYEGITILASNLRHNMDEAFLRRLRFIVDFPFPEPAQRLLIWRAHLRAGAPLAADLDLPLLADRLAVSGGTIRNVVLSASFLAAAEDTAVGMDQLLRAARRELAKSDAVWRSDMFPATGARGGDR
jgi:MoxR-like ATPase